MTDPVVSGGNIRNMPPPNEQLGSSFPLAALQNEIGDPVFYDPSYPDAACQPDTAPTWMDPELFLGYCLANENIRDRLQWLIDEEAVEADDEALSELLESVFESEYLVTVLGYFDQIQPLFAECLLRRYAEEITTKRKKPRKARKPKKDIHYRWVCTCGGTHYFPVEYCRNCGGVDIKREETRSPLGYVYR